MRRRTKHTVKKKTDESRPYLFIPTSKGDIKVLWSDIVSCEGSRSYTTLHLRNKLKLENLPFNLKDFERALPSKFFFSVHKRWIVHLDHIYKYITLQVIMDIEFPPIPVSPSKKKELLNRLHILKHGLK
jgi:DNA-binding LytR/AlgR family response regulator